MPNDIPTRTWKIEFKSEAATDRFGEALATTVRPNQVIGLIGPLGAGKTRLVRALATALNVDPSAISSPTFVLIQEYQGNLPIFHFDVYRLKSPDEFEALGVSDYWDAGGLCLVEWADLVLDCLPRSSWFITLKPTGPEAREAILRGPGIDRLAASLGDDAIEV